jgi:hypothetical protein
MLSPERGLKALLRRADKLGARYALIMGENELARGVVQVRDLKASTQREIAGNAVAAEIAAGGAETSLESSSVNRKRELPPVRPQSGRRIITFDE